MEDKTKIPLTAAEMSSLWSQYINDTLAICMSKYFIKIAEDPEVQEVIQLLKQFAEKHVVIITDIFEKSDFPVPIGFTEDDVDTEAPRLFSDTYILMYLNQLSILAMTLHTGSLAMVTRPDVVDFHKGGLERSVILKTSIQNLMLKQGIFTKPPYITPPDKVDFVKKQRFLNGFFGKKRMLSMAEITQLFLNAQTNDVGKVLMIAFAQTSDNKEIKEYFIRGKDIATKHIEAFNRYLVKEDLPAPMTWDSSVTDSRVRVFSDKLMLYQVSAMIATGIGNYGVSLAASPRRDLAAKYASLLSEIALYAEDGYNLMIKHGWMEEPPLADNRDNLMK